MSTGNHALDWVIAVCFGLAAIVGGFKSIGWFLAKFRKADEIVTTLQQIAEEWPRNGRPAVQKLDLVVNDVGHMKDIAKSTNETVAGLSEQLARHLQTCVTWDALMVAGVIPAPRDPSE